MVSIMNKPLKLTICVHCYPPDLRVSARRWGSLVSCLCASGVDCTVIAAGDGVYHEYVGKNGERVIRLPILNRTLQTMQAKNKKTMSVKKCVKALLSYAIPPLLLSFSMQQWRAQFTFRRKLLRIARESDCIISSYGPLNPFLLGWRLAVKTNRPWIADLRDSFESRDGGASRWAKSVSRILEKRLLQRAKQRVTVGEYLARHLSSVCQADFSAIYNGWTDADLVKEPRKKEFEEPYLYYAGSIYDHRMPALSIVCEAIQKHPKIKLKIRLLNDHTQGSLRQLMAGLCEQKKIELLPPVEQQIVDQELADAAGVLVIESLDNNDVMRNGTVTGKLIGLLASGIPGIAVSSPSGEIRHLVEKTPGWHGVETIKQCTAALDDLMKPHHVKSNRQYLIDYHMSEQAERLLGLIKNVI